MAVNVVVGPGLVEALEVHVVGVRGALDAADLEPQRESVRLGLAGANLEDPVARCGGDDEQRGEIVHVEP